MGKISETMSILKERLKEEKVEIPKERLIIMVEDALDVGEMSAKQYIRDMLRRNIIRESSRMSYKVIEQK